MADGFASLTSGLLARKGQARPAMRPQGFATPTTGLEDLGWNDMGQDGPRPIGVRLPTHLSGAPVPVVVRQQEELAAAVEVAPEPAPAAVADLPVEPLLSVVAPVEPVLQAAAPIEIDPAPAAVEAPVARRIAPKRVGKSLTPEAEAPPRSTGRKAAFTLRLDVDRHLRLRLACAVENRSAQQLVIRALDQLLGDMPDVDRLAQSLPTANS